MTKATTGHPYYLTQLVEDYLPVKLKEKNVFSVHVYLCTICMKYLWSLEEAIRFPRTEVTDDD